MNKCKLCERKSVLRGLCRAHYSAARKRGLIAVIQPHVPKDASIQDRLKKYSQPLPEGECVLWIGCVDGNGYGQISVNGKMLLAHRVSWEIANERPAGDLHVLHRCDTPPPPMKGWMEFHEDEAETA